MIAGNVQQSECSQNVGFDKSLRAADGIVNMAFGGKVNYAFDVIFTEQFFHQCAVADIALNESVAVSYTHLDVYKRQIQHFV